MKFQSLSVCVVVMFFSNVVLLPCGTAQIQGDAVDNGKRQQATQLFEKGNRLEALPLLEELVRKNPRDHELLLDLSACLVSHAATLTDQQAAAKERLRAKNLVQEALDLGDNSLLAQNLHQLLGALPPIGAIEFSRNPSVEHAMLAGEAAFSRRDFVTARKNYARALQLEPKNYAAVLFTGNTYHKENAYVKAGEWYERAIQLDPKVETAYRYYAEMLVKEGDMSKARSMLIHAAVAEPYNRIVWRDLIAWAALNRSELNFKYAGLSSEPKAPGQNESMFDVHFDVNFFLQRPKDLSDAWQAYRSVRADWKGGGKFKQHFPHESVYRHSLAEEVEALTAEVGVLEKLEGDVETAEIVTEKPSLLLLLKLHQEGVLEPYVLFRLADEDIAKDYPVYQARHRDRLEQYLDKFVVPTALGKTIEVLTAPAQH
ncbi:MAG TPA: tetratricopeptide repeat protein [Candidatus Sulfotelmatobacter sp.]|nr:tetratricopeptide repeat protein [Candidatus Sulfotelmatobacter sp.]